MAQSEIVLITGSSGFIGSAIIRKFADRFRLIGLDRAGPPHPPPPAECIEVDLTSSGSVDAAVEHVRSRHGSSIASVIHLAAYFDLTGEPNRKYQEITAGGTERLLRALQPFAVEQLIFASSMLVHAPGKPDQLINEDWPLDPKLPYRESKIETERLIHAQRGSIPVVFARPAGVYDDLCHSAFLAQQIARIYERNPKGHVYPGDLETGQSFIHVDDLADALLRLVERRAQLPAELPLLLGEPEVLGVGEMQRMMGRLLHGEDWETWQIPKSLARAGAWVEDRVIGEDQFIKPWMVDIADDHYAIDIGRARALLDWAPTHSLRTTLPRMVSALKADPVGWYKTNELNAAKVATWGPTPAAEIAGEHRPHSQHSMDMAGKGAEGESSSCHGEAAPMHDHEMEMSAERQQMRWTHLVTIGLGAWLMTSPVVFGLFGGEGFSEGVQRVTAERGLPTPEWRSTVLAWSDLVSGLLIMSFGALSLSARFSWAQWGNTAVGLWLLFAPLLFWAPSAAVYANDTLIGSLVIAFSVLISMMPGMSMAGMMDPKAIPPGWTYCPSTAAQRLPIVIMGLVGFVIARWLTAYQLGHVDNVWEPFFSGDGRKNGTEFIITSDVSKAWPIPDAGLGAVAYMLEILMAAMGDKRRWRTMPWMVTFFGILVVPLGVVSIYFIIIQPIVIGTYCTLCLLAAVAMLIMIPFALDELIAMGQFLTWTHRDGKPFWRTFFKGDAMDGGGEDPSDSLASAQTAARDTVRGVTMPWTLAVSVVLGIWLMFTSRTLDTTGLMSHSDHLVGALVITTAIIAMAEVARPLRFVNALFGGWLVVAPWILEGASSMASWFGVAVGVSLIVLSLPRGRRSQEHYGSWDRYVF